MVTTQERDIIINAIRVLRSRRVRPSARKIAWYVRREHLLSELTTEAVLDELVESEDVLRVEYKGATSYRVAASWAKADLVKRRPTRTKVNVMNSESTCRALRSAVEACGQTGASKEQIEEKLAASGQHRLIDKLDLLLHREIRAGTLLRVETTHRTATLITYVVPADTPLPPPSSPPSPATEDLEDTDIAEEIEDMEEEESPSDVIPMHFLEVKKTPIPTETLKPETVSVTRDIEKPQEESSGHLSSFGGSSMTAGGIRRGMGGARRGRRGRPPTKGLGSPQPLICSSSRGRPPSKRNK
ncbi:hypothetical protein SK128_019296, partial [Halocaridina rubra]